MNKRVIDVYGSKDGQLILRICNYETGKIETVKRDKDVEVFLYQLDKYPIMAVKEEKQNGKEFATINYQGFDLQMHDVDHLNEKETYLNPLYNSLEKYFEKQKLQELSKKNNDKRKVQRNNKYTNQKIIATALTIGLLASTITTIMAQRKINTSQDITKEDYVAMDTVDYNEMYESLKQQVIFDASFDMEHIKNIKKDVSDKVILDYEDLSNTDKAIFAKEEYGSIIEKYANRYGLDPKLVLGIATQERGVHSTEMDRGGATGLMQIQNSVWLGNEISAYNFETGKYDKFVVTNDMIKDLDTNIQLGCMVFQNCLNYVNYNIPMAIQTYNYGIGNMKKVIDVYAGISGKTKEEVINNPNDIGWIEYRDIINVGDTNYLNHVLSWLGEENSVSVMRKDDTAVDLTISNNLVVNKTY